MADQLLTELHEDLKREKMDNFFKKNGKFLMTLALLFILTVGGYEIWKQQDINAREHAGDKLYQLISNFDSKKNPADLHEIAKTNGYKEVTALIEANLYEAKDMNAEVLKAYEKLANDESANPALRQLAQINVASIKLNKSPTDSGAEAELIKLAKDDGIYRYTAQEMLGSYYRKNGKTAEAKAIFKKLAEDEKAPRTLSGRAKSMLSSF